MFLSLGMYIGIYTLVCALLEIKDGRDGGIVFALTVCIVFLELPSGMVPVEYSDAMSEIGFSLFVGVARVNIPRRGGSSAV